MSLKSISLIAAASIAAFATIAHAQQEGAAEERPLSRAEVIADMQVWNEAGVPPMLQHRDGPRHPEFLAAFAKYRQLRTDPAFEKRVDAIARERGELLKTAAK